MDTTQTTHALIHHARAALDVLETAERAGLPLPFIVQASDYSDDVAVQFHSLADLNDWALWLESQIEDSKHRGHIHHSVTGTVRGHQVVAVALTNRNHQC